MAKYAVILVGSRQYWVQENDLFEVERFPAGLTTKAAKAKEVAFKDVLLVQENGKSKVGQPFVPKASVTCEVLGEHRLPKVISFKFKRRKGYKRKKGHRQTVVRLRVKKIEVG